MVTVKFFTLLRLLIKLPSVEVSWAAGDTVKDVLQRVDNYVTVAFMHKLLDEKGDLKSGTIILLEGQNIFHLRKLDTPVDEGSTLDLFPPGGGG